MDIISLCVSYIFHKAKEYIFFDKIPYLDFLQNFEDCQNARNWLLPLTLSETTVAFFKNPLMIFRDHMVSSKQLRNANIIARGFDRVRSIKMEQINNAFHENREFGYQHKGTERTYTRKERYGAKNHD